MTDKAAVHLIFELAIATKAPIKHFDITNAYTREPADPSYKLCVKKPAMFDGT